MALTEQEQQKVENAKVLIEEAQRLILSASQELCPVNGMAREWSANNRLYETVKKHWYRVEARQQRLSPRRRVA